MYINRTAAAAYGIFILLAFILMIAASVTGSSAEEREIRYWTCGMHPSVHSDDSGKCPLCNMDLVPVFKESVEEAAKEREIRYWTCGMHPSVHEDDSGKCPICNMDLVPVYGEAETVSGRDESFKEIELRISPAAARLARIKTVEIKRRTLTKTIRAAGEVDYDETRMAVIAARVGGRIEKLYADYTGKEFDSGEPLALLYSPELFSAQQEYLLVRDSGLGNAARQKLLLWGITERQIRDIERRGKPQPNLAISAPIGGTVVHKNVVEGAYVNEGSTLFHIADLSRVWVVADIFDNDLGSVSLNQEAAVTSQVFPGDTIGGRITFIDPFMDRITRSAKVRIEVDNPDRKLIPGMFVDVEIKKPVTYGEGAVWGGGRESMPGVESMPGKSIEIEAAGSRMHGDHRFNGNGSSGEQVLAVPRSAVVNTGLRTVAFVEIGEGRYVLRRVELGAEAEGYYVVLKGLSEGELVVERGSFLLDSQTQLTGEAEEIYGGALGKDSEKLDQKHMH